MMTRSCCAVVACLGALACTASHVSSKQIQEVRPIPTSCASAPGADSTVFDSSQVTERAAPRSVPKPEYPAEARNKKIQGRTVISAVVDADGSVEPSSVTVTTSANPLLDAEARRLVAATTFWPACHDGAAVRSRIVVPLDFKLTGEKNAAVGFGILAGVWVGLMGAMMN